MESLEHERANISSLNCNDIYIWQVHILHYVLSDYLSKSHNFKNLFFVTSSLSSSISLLVEKHNLVRRFSRSMVQ